MRSISHSRSDGSVGLSLGVVVAQSGADRRAHLAAGLEAAVVGQLRHSSGDLNVDSAAAIGSQSLAVHLHADDHVLLSGVILSLQLVGQVVGGQTLASDNVDLTGQQSLDLRNQSGQGFEGSIFNSSHTFHSY